MEWWLWVVLSLVFVWLNLIWYYTVEKLKERSIALSTKPPIENLPCDLENTLTRYRLRLNCNEIVKVCCGVIPRTYRIECEAGEISIRFKLTYNSLNDSEKFVESILKNRFREHEPPKGGIILPSDEYSYSGIIDVSSTEILIENLFSEESYVNVVYLN